MVPFSGRERERHVRSVAAFCLAAVVVAITHSPAFAGSSFFDDWSSSAVGAGPDSAWGVENAQDPNNHSVNYYNTLPSQATTSRLTTLQVINDPTSGNANNKALRMTILPDPNFATNHIYQSAEISTRLDPGGKGNNLQYGHIEAKIKVAGGAGSGADSVWPAFWMLGSNYNFGNWPNCGEIDIMETKGSQENVNQAHLHTNIKNTTNDVNNGSGVGGTSTLPSGALMYNAYHTYAMDWSPGSISWSIDGTKYLTETPSSSNFTSVNGNWVFDDHPFYLILDICQGGPFATTGNNITAPLNMDIAYVSVSTPEPASILLLAGGMVPLLMRRRRAGR